MWKDQLHLHFIVLLWGFTAILGKLIQFPAVELILLRCIITLPALYAIARWKGIRLVLPPKVLLRVLSIGFLIGIHWICFYAAIKVAKASIALAGLPLSALFSSIMEPYLKKVKLKKYELVLGLFTLIGIYVIFQFELGYWLGLVLSVLAAFFSALFSTLNTKLAGVHDSISVTFYEVLGAGILCGVCALVLPFVTGEPSGLLLENITMYDWMFLVILAWCCTAYPFYISVDILKRVSAYNLNLVVNMEPIYGIVLAWMVFGQNEQMTFGFYLGAGIILTSVALYPIVDRYFKKKANTIAA